jgi:hypothetical protein
VVEEKEIQKGGLFPYLIIIQSHSMFNVFIIARAHAQKKVKRSIKKGGKSKGIKKPR